MSEVTEAEAKRFTAKSKRVVDCLVWQGALDRDGYGSFYFRGANRRAHRMAWYIANGAIPDGFVVNHTCRNRACVNPQHLQMVTARDNALKDSSSVGYVNSQKTKCPNGHPYDKRVMWAGRTQRVCSVCDRETRNAAKRRRYHAGKSAIRI
ncbi:HNH endonuclease signature motif containing protein [Mycobacteroides abscessus]|uniref:HNH endonuclease signature motif containing protein n=1 Tax=Mycobacteroides abscessus TaxID=36809 RepID=UPI000C258582